MSNLSFTQEFFLCAINSKGKIPLVDGGETPVCLAIGGIKELVDHGFVTRGERDKLTIAKPWNDSLPHLLPLYQRIESYKRPKTTLKVVRRYARRKHKKKLVAAFQASLIEAGCTDGLAKVGLGTTRQYYPPKPEAVARVIEKIRVELATGSPFSDQTVWLLALLDGASWINRHFGKMESKALKTRREEVRQHGVYMLVMRATIWRQWWLNWP